MLLAATYVAWLLGTSGDLGYARDEGFYFHAAARYQAWFELLLEAPDRALAPAVLDYHWAVNREHPAFVKSLFSLSHALFYQRWAMFEEAGTSYRFVGMLFGGLLVAAVYSWGRRETGVGGGLAAALALMLMPRFFYHAHLSCFDVPVTCLWFLTVYAYARALDDGRWRWAVATGVCFGLLLNTKHNSWLLPPVLVAHFCVHWAAQRRWALGPPSSKVLWCLALLGPPVFFAGWPWLWRDTWQRLLEYVTFHTGHEYYNMEFLGQTYFKPPMPRLYAWLMTLATVPATTLLLFGVGLLLVGRRCLRASGWQSLLPARLQSLLPCVKVEAEVASARPAAQQSVLLLWVLALLAGYAPWLSSSTPIFGGTKHWMTAYPFLALMAGLGFSWTLTAMRRALSSAKQRRLACVGLGLVVVAPPLWMTIESHPFGLSTYTPLVGSAPGAASLGLNRTFWGYTTGSLQDVINREAPLGATLYLHDTARSSFAMLQRDGRIRADIRPTLDIASSNLALYHHEPHMGRVDYQIWVNYGTLQPTELAVHQGVPVAWMYRRPSQPP